MMTKLNQKKNEMNLSLFEIITSHEVEDQCTNITKWFNQYYHLDGLGFFLRDFRSCIERADNTSRK